MPEMILVCYCRNPAKLNTSWSNDNLSRGFFGVRNLAVDFKNHVGFSPSLIHH
ncbi:hypothetical protein Golob_001096 [Gossypium lobatum]|uniref:Uncharacterized protein n=1 Tax=Gossypium lobatum TaxID=34289 RepID=A0A7J8NA81_9ROSI|nr:hypothetical protein [Gossypium lobatum]